jgi:hypothetical protein
MLDALWKDAGLAMINGVLTEIVPPIEGTNNQAPTSSERVDMETSNDDTNIQPPPTTTEVEILHPRIDRSLQLIQKLQRQQRLKMKDRSKEAENARSSAGNLTIISQRKKSDKIRKLKVGKFTAKRIDFLNQPPLPTIEEGTQEEGDPPNHEDSSVTLGSSDDMCESSSEDSDLSSDEDEVEQPNLNIRNSPNINQTMGDTPPLDPDPSKC